MFGAQLLRSKFRSGSFASALPCPPSGPLSTIPDITGRELGRRSRPIRTATARQTPFAAFESPWFPPAQQKLVAVDYKNGDDWNRIPVKYEPTGGLAHFFAASSLVGRIGPAPHTGQYVQPCSAVTLRSYAAKTWRAFIERLSTLRRAIRARKLSAPRPDRAGCLPEHCDRRPQC